MKHTVSILDDLVLKITNLADLVTLFTITAHYSGISVVYIAQNFFPPGKYSKSISLNCHLIIVFRNARDDHTWISDFPVKGQFF